MSVGAFSQKVSRAPISVECLLSMTLLSGDELPAEARESEAGAGAGAGAWNKTKSKETALRNVFELMPKRRFAEADEDDGDDFFDEEFDGSSGGDTTDGETTDGATTDGATTDGGETDVPDEDQDEDYSASELSSSSDDSDEFAPSSTRSGTQSKATSPDRSSRPATGEGSRPVSRERGEGSRPVSRERRPTPPPKALPRSFFEDDDPDIAYIVETRAKLAELKVGRCMLKAPGFTFQHLKLANDELLSCSLALDFNSSRSST
jgi:hypothetical protein